MRYVTDNQDNPNRVCYMHAYCYGEKAECTGVMGYALAERNNVR